MAHPSHSGLGSLHAILAAYPLAFFTAALGTDIVYANSANMQWANFSAWLITIGVVMTVVAAIAGIVDALVWKRARRPGWTLHSILTTATLVVGIFNALIHSRDAWTSVVPTGLILSAITAVLVLASSWIGYRVADARPGDVA